jgi:prepilin-type N-terminal cleavage/methylation domain-containing protein
MMNQKGFTLVERITVLLLIAILGGLAVMKYGSLENTASERVGEQIIQQMTTEALDGWVKAKFVGWIDDEQCFALENYSWADFSGGGAGGILKIKGHPINVKRVPSTDSTPAVWRKQ